MRRNFTEGRSRTVSFRSANEFAGYLVFGNDNASETQCDAGAVVFQADSATDGFKITNNETIYIGAGDGEGSIKVESGTYNAQCWVVGQGKTASVEVTGGTVTSRGSAYVGQNNGSAGTLTVSDGGVFVCGEGTGETQLQLSQYEGSTGTININEGGTLVTAHIQPGTGTPIVNFNGGTLKLNYGGTVFGSRDNFTNYVNEAGGTLDTAGFETYVKALIKGEGTLKITGGGTVMTAAVSGDSFTLAYDLTGKITPPPTVDGVTLSYAIKSSDDPTFSGDVTTTASTSLAFADAGLYNRLVASIAAAQ